MVATRSEPCRSDAGKERREGIVVAVIGARAGVGARTLTRNIGAILTGWGLQVVVQDRRPGPTRRASDDRSMPREAACDDAPDLNVSRAPESRAPDEDGLPVSPWTNCDVELLHHAPDEACDLRPTADVVALVITPHPAVLVDGYALLKSLHQRGFAGRMVAIVNRVRNQPEAERAAGRLVKTVGQFLGRSLEILGYVPQDRHVALAADRGEPVAHAFRRCAASSALGVICTRLMPGRARRVVAPALWSRLGALFL